MQPNATPAFPIAWAEVLENVEKTLALAEAEAARSEQALNSPESADSPPAEPVWQKALDRLEERFRQLRGCLAEAELNATQAEKSLQHSEERLQRWRLEAEAMRQRLANEAIPAVS